ncbi:Digeranylgeranylglycerophospholipid reductase [Candidatus Norongarragalina meridionalis]|nr:Digeranylgeranylglycerophospholipid reductase [Candidatus Norongarragalina meridionalis]
MRYDVSVVGAGAIGCITAKECAARGLRTAVYEEDAIVGKQRKCTALVSESGLRSIGVDYKRAVLHKVRGAFIEAGGKRMLVDARRNIACVLERQRFDEQCAEEAESEGAKIFLRKKVRALPKEKWIVGADGASSFIARAASFPPITRFAFCYEAEYKNARVEDEAFVRVFLDSAFPGFFGWLVPCGNNVVRVGFGTQKHERMNEGKRRIASITSNSVTKSSKKLREFHALIPLKWRSQTQRGNVMLVGDAAGQVKATTGGGLVFGGNCARILAESIAENRNYEKEWKKECLPTLKLHYLVRRKLDLLPSGITLAAAKPFASLVSRFGDMDNIIRV